MIQCTNCGTANQDGTAFCFNCGTPLSPAPLGAPAAAAPTKGKVNVSGKAIPLPLLIGVPVLFLCICAVCAILIVALMLLSSQNVAGNVDAPPTERPIAVLPTQINPTALAAGATPTLRPPGPPQLRGADISASLSVASYTSNRDIIGALYFYGELSNNGTIPAQRVQIVLSLLDASGNVLAAESANLSELDIALPNTKYPFKFLVTKAPKEWKEVKIQVQAEPYSDSPFMIFRPYLDLKTDKVTGQLSQLGVYSLSGKVTNLGNKTAGFVKIVGVAYDKNGKVIDVADGYSSLDKVQAGKDSPFQIMFGYIKAAPASYVVFAQGRESQWAGTGTPGATVQHPLITRNTRSSFSSSSPLRSHAKRST